MKTETIETIQYESGPQQPAVPWQNLTGWGIAIGIVLLIIWGNRRKKQAFEELSTFLQGSSGGNSFLNNFWFRCVYKKHPLEIRNVPGKGRGNPEYVSYVYEELPLALDLEITKEDSMKRTLQNMGLAEDIQTRDPVFDRRFTIKSRTENLAVKYLALKDVRAAITALFDEGVFSLELVPGGDAGRGFMRLKKLNPELESDMRPQKLLPLLDRMDYLCSERRGGEFSGNPEGRDGAPAK